MARGWVKQWDINKGNGFIIEETKENDWFFRASSLKDLSPADIVPDMLVEFDPKDGRLPEARNVRKRSVLARTRITSAMLKRVPVSEDVQRILINVNVHERHPGLQLDKYGLPCPKQEQQKNALVQVIESNRGSSIRSVYDELRGRRIAMLQAIKANGWTRTTSGPLTLGLARTSALENAGLSLHPIHGFAYLPGTGLKGLARAYAETVWLVSQADPVKAWATIERVFGWAPGSDRDKCWKPNGVPEHDKAHASNRGAIVFQDAWPTKWPELIIDIVNNHHPTYYQEGKPPGDWDSPNPVYFLAVEPDTTFEFALGKGAYDVSDKDLDLAHQWLDGALTHLGCGAKTVAGYGYFSTEPEDLGPSRSLVQQDWEGALKQSAHTEMNSGIGRADQVVTLELITPALLAGAEQGEADCDLRPATLRGLLRWWWRTMHAGFLKDAELANLEATLWGDTIGGGAIQTVLRPLSRPSPRRFNYRDSNRRFLPSASFKAQHDLADAPSRTTQGLFYASYGMDDDQKRASRYHLDPGASWNLHLIARPTRFFRKREDANKAVQKSSAQVLSAEQVLEQASLALWLFCTYGGAGSKARKGFGSIQCELLQTNDSGSIKKLTLIDCQAAASNLRNHLKLSPEAPTSHPNSPALSKVLELPTIDTPWSDPWTVMDRVGFAYQAFAQRFKHDVDREGKLIPTWSDSARSGYTKATLGLPRKIHGPRDDGPMKGQRNWQPPVWLQRDGQDPADSSADDRYASPVHLHLSRRDDGGLSVRGLAFPPADLPALPQSEAFLSEFLQMFQAELTALITNRRANSSNMPVRQSQSHRSGILKPVPSQGNAASPLKPKDRVEAVLLEERTKKGGWKARHLASGWSGPILDWQKVPADKAPGDVLTLVVDSLNASNKFIQFKLG